MTGWGRRIRTFADGSRVRCPTARRFPSTRTIIADNIANSGARVKGMQVTAAYHFAYHSGVCCAVESLYSDLLQDIIPLAEAFYGSPC